MEKKQKEDKGGLIFTSLDLPTEWCVLVILFLSLAVLAMLFLPKSL